MARYRTVRVRDDYTCQGMTPERLVDMWVGMVEQGFYRTDLSNEKEIMKVAKDLAKRWRFSVDEMFQAFTTALQNRKKSVS